MILHLFHKFRQRILRKHLLFLRFLVARPPIDHHRLQMRAMNWLPPRRQNLLGVMEDLDLVCFDLETSSGIAGVVAVVQVQARRDRPPPRVAQPLEVAEDPDIWDLPDRDMVPRRVPVAVVEDRQGVPKPRPTELDRVPALEHTVVASRLEAEARILIRKPATVWQMVVPSVVEVDLVEPLLQRVVVPVVVPLAVEADLEVVLVSPPVLPAALEAEADLEVPVEAASVAAFLEVSVEAVVPLEGSEVSLRVGTPVVPLEDTQVEAPEVLPEDTQVEAPVADTRVVIRKHLYCLSTRTMMRF